MSTDNVVELRQPIPLAPNPEATLEIGDDLQASLDADDGWLYIEDRIDGLSVVAINGDEAKQLRDWLVKVLPT